jgi:uncharacterized membrane protein YqaE (UPF0057 family)
MKRLLLYVLASSLLLTSVQPLSAATIPSAVPTEKPDPALVKAAVEAFKSLPKKERKAKVKELKKELKKIKAERKAGKDPSTNTVLMVILAIILPPLAVYLHEGDTNKRFWISVLLTLLFWIPGIIYALILILGDN